MAKAIVERWQKDTALINPWLEMGARYGDIYRRCLINPVIYGLLVASDWREAPSPIHFALAKWHKTYCMNGAALPDDKWYEEWGKMTGRAHSILDLGCGEAYRGRWLSKPGVNYVGVDVSESLLKSALEKGAFHCVVRDLDTPDPLTGIWSDVAPPEWTLAITLLDQLEHPERLLRDVAALYGTRHTGLMLAVTCNPEFYGYSGEEAHPVAARIATVAADGGGGAYLRSRQSLRKMFRESGMHVLDEASPHLPAALATQGSFDTTKLNLAHSPFVFWLLELHSTKRDQVELQDIKNWLTELGPGSLEVEAVRALLERLEPEAAHLHWRRFQKDQVVVHRHNIGGRLFVVRDGTFEVDTSNAGLSNESRSGARKRWKFRANEVFGELEIQQEAEQRELRYSASVVAGREGDRGHAEALEVPAEVTQRLMQASSLLGNPFFNVLRRKVLNGLLRYDQASFPVSVTSEKRFRKTLQIHQAPKDQLQLTIGPVVAVASLLLHGLDADRERGMVRDPRHRLVVVAHLRKALSEVTGRSIEKDHMTSFNRAIRFLAAAGVLRSIRPVASEGRGTGEATANGTRHGTLSTQFKEELAKEEWVAGLNSEAGAASKRLMSLQSACLFLVDDEIALRRCVMEPSLPLIDDLAQRRKIFFPQPLDVERARDADLAQAVKEGLRVRFTSNHWRTDSVGLSLGDD